MAIMEGSDPKEKLDSAYWSALKSNWILWPAVQAINFKFVPLEHRVLVVNIVSLGESSPATSIDLQYECQEGYRRQPSFYS